MLPLLSRRKSKKSILFVENNEIMHHLITKILEKNYEVHSYTNAIDAIQWLSETDKKPDAILSDITMPEMSGIEFVQFLNINGLYNHIPVIFMSGLSEEEIKSELIAVDYTAYAQKPISPIHLVDKIEKATSYHLA